MNFGRVIFELLLSSSQAPHDDTLAQGFLNFELVFFPYKEYPTPQKLAKLRKLSDTAELTNSDFMLASTHIRYILLLPRYRVSEPVPHNILSSSIPSEYMDKIRIL